MTDLIERMRAHVNNRGGASIENGAWQMMLDAADELERLRSGLQDISRIGQWSGTDGGLYTSKEGRLARNILGGPWQDISTAPKDGTIIDLTWLEDNQPQEIWPMQWAHIQKNGLFPGRVGMWTAPDGSITWNDDHPDGAPTHWRPSSSLTSNKLGGE